MFFTLLYVSNIFAQGYLFPNYEIKQALDFYHYNNSEIEQFSENLSAEKIIGSPFLNEEFIEGSIFTTSKTQYVSIPLRYNIYNDQVEFKSNDEKAYAITVPEVIEAIVFGDYQLEYIPYLAANKIRRGYFTVLSKGDATLYIKQKVIFEEAKKAAAYKDPQPPKFIRKSDEFYIRIGMDAAKPVYKNKDLLDMFSHENDKISAFIKNNKIKSNNAKSLTELVSYYNSL